MKHSLKITLFLLSLFLIAQFLGIAILYKYIDIEKSKLEGETEFKDLPFGERPRLEENTSFVTVILAVLFGTGIAFLLIKFGLIWIWKAWFFLAVAISLSVALSAFLNEIVSVVLAIIVAFWKLLKPNFWTQNISELFIYGGLAVIFVPLFNLISVSILLVLIAVYDAYAVWKSRHMIVLAKSQAKARMFAGLLIPYRAGKAAYFEQKKEEAEEKIKPKDTSIKMKAAAKAPVKVRTAILGGGDIGFPLIFSGVILKEIGLWQSLMIPFFAAAGLAFLLWKSDEKKFYPAMPFIGAGCFLGLGIVWWLGLLI